MQPDRFTFYVYEAVDQDGSYTTETISYIVLKAGLENDKPLSPEYMAQISLWLIMAGNARGFGIEEFPTDPPKIPEI